MASAHRRRAVLVSNASRFIDQNPGWASRLENALRNEGRTKEGTDDVAPKEGQGFVFHREEEDLN